MKKKISLTGIKPTGTPHIGNYLGAIKPALELAKEYEARYFIADYHALNTIRNPEELSSYTKEVAATWLACGLDPEKMLLYRQSHIPQTFELTTILMAFAAKGLMNRAHAYKAAVAQNLENGKDPDYAINMGLYTYPVLMAADILLFDTNIVPVGKDQKQHVEMAVDIAQTINHNYKQELLVLPEAKLTEDLQTIVGIDGRKMSKSYNNTIPLFLPPKKLKKLIMKIVTNSQTVEEPKSIENCNVFSIYKLFATKEEQEKLKEKYEAGGMGWGEAKQILFEKLNEFLTPMREKYEVLINNWDEVEKILQQGEEKARDLAADKLKILRKAIGIEY
jgi:tryptophanyl-tRNA synthetase